MSAEIEDTPVDREADTADVATSSRLRRWIAPAWFLLGALIGVIGFAVYTILTVKPPVIDTVALREASRNGTLDAIATLQAGGAPPAASGAPDTVPANTSFALRDANRQGDKNAPIVMVEFSDFQCPFCGRFFMTVEPDVRQQYIDTGKVTFVYKHMAILGQESVWAAEASECAADQGKFWEYHDLIFNRQSGENQGTFTKENLLSLAKELNLDMSKFEPCLKNDQTLDRVQADTQEGQQAGVRGTPTFFINGQPIVGAQPLEAFQAAFNKASNGK